MIARIRILLLLLTGFVLHAHAQNPESDIDIAAVVKDAAGQPVEGVSISIQEKAAVTTTNAQGAFTLSCRANDVIIFRKTGYNTLAKPAPEIDGSMPVVLQKSLIEAGDNDNVYIPSGIRKRRDISASISTIKGSRLPQLPLASLNNALTGRLPGLLIRQTGNRPGVDDAALLVRGRSSYNSNQQPLILVDGVVRDFSAMDLNEIESISVLKDAATLSWYGMNGANGVVYVTTRRGSASNTRVTFDVQGGVQTPSIITKPLDAFTYASLYNEAQMNSGLTPQYDQTALDAYKNGTDPFKYPNNNFVDRFIKKAAPVQRYVATVSGGNSFAQYFTLISFYNQAGLYDGANNENYKGNTNYQRYNIRTNLNLHINKSLDVSLDVGGRVENLRYPTTGNANLLTAIYSTPANAFPLLNPNGTYGGSTLFRTQNPLALLNANGNTTDLVRTMLATLDIKHKLNFITKGLSLNIFYTYDITSNYTSGYDQGYAVYEANTSGGYNQYGTETPLAYSTTDFNSNLRNNEFWGGFDYDRNAGEHGFRFSTRYQRAVSNSPSRLDNTREGFSNRLSYNYKQRYFADMVATYSGSQNFAPGKRWGWFPAVSAGWILSDEKFIHGGHVLNYLKLRGSVGLVGNDGISARRFAFSNYYNRGGTQYVFGTSFASANSTTEIELANRNLTWEKATKASAGFDAALFGQSLSLSAEYFYERRTDLLTTALLPNVLGQSVVDANQGKAQYKGFETSAGYIQKFGNVTITLNANFTYAKSTILALNEEAGLPAYQKQTGFGIGRVVVYNSETSSDYYGRFLQADGIFQTQAEIDAAPVQRFSGVVRPGDIRYKDINGDNVIDNLDFVMTNYSDIPDKYYGFGAKINVKNFDVAAQFQGVAGRTIQINNIINSGNSATGYINQFSVDAWTAAKGASALYPRLAISDRGNNTQQSTYWLRSGDFLKLRNVEIGYNLSAVSLKRLKINTCRFYISGYNLLTFSKLNKLDIDPEMPTAGYNNSYPYLRTFAAGINLKF